MVKKIPTYVCEKCGYYDLNREKIEKHKKKPITGVCASLDGLIVRFHAYKKDISVFRRVRQGITANGKHEALYTWDNYKGKGLAKEYKDFKEMQEINVLVEKTFGPAHFTASNIKGSTLYGGKSENIYKQYHELSTQEFGRVRKLLKKK